MWSALRCLNRIQVPPLIKTSIRHYRKTSEKMELLLKQADRIPLNSELVYRYTSCRTLGFIYHTINFSTCLTAAAAAYYVYSQGFTPNLDVPEIFKMFDNPIEIAIAVFVSTLTLIGAAVLRRRYIIRLYYNKQSKMYRAIFIGKIPFTLEHYDFPPACLIHISKNSLLPWRNTLFNANGRKIMLFEENFRTLSDFYDMLDPNELKHWNLRS